MVRGKRIVKEVINPDDNKQWRGMFNSIAAIFEYQRFEPGLVITLKVLPNQNILLTHNGRRD